MVDDKALAVELAVGYVIQLCPKQLLGLGAKPTGPAERWVVDFHSFVVIQADAKRCRLLPLYSNTGPERVEIGLAGRSGHPYWTGGTWHYHPAQTWTASRQAIARAAAAAHDPSRPGFRNVLAAAYVPTIP